MSSRTVEEQVEALLERRVVETRVAGTPNPSAEAVAVFDSVALSLVLQPRASLYLAYLARNGLASVVQEEIALIDSMMAAVRDLSNPSYRIEGATTLQRAKLALLQMERLPRIDSSSTALSLYSKAVDEFLNKHLSKNVRRSGESEMIRPASEASLDLQATYLELVQAHSEMLDRLYVLPVGVDNFINAPFTAVIGTSTVAKARLDIDDMISSVQAGGSSSLSRDFVVRLISGRSTIKSLSAAPNPFADLLNGPGKTARAKAELVSSSGPFDPNLSTDPIFPRLSFDVSGTQQSFFAFPKDTAYLLSGAIAFPLTVPSTHGLFVSIDDVPHRLPFDGRTFTTVQELADFITVANVGGLHGAAFGTSRLMLYVAAADTLDVLALYQYSEADSIALGMTVTAGYVTALSAHGLLNIDPWSRGTQYVSASDLADAVELHFPTLHAAAISDERVLVQVLDDAPGSYITSFSTFPGFDSGKHSALSALVTLDGITDHRAVVQSGDIVFLGTSRAVVAEVHEDTIVLSSEAPTFFGTVRCKSVLVEVYEAFTGGLRVFMQQWAGTSFATDLAEVDRAVAALTSSQSPAQQSETLRILEKLRSHLSSLLSLTTDASTMLPPGAAGEERRVVEGILATLHERQFNRAADLLLRCDIQALLEMDADKATYGANFLRAASTFARASFTYEDPVLTNQTDSISAGHN